jgi:peptide/nickel transport system permease protein
MIGALRKSRGWGKFRRNRGAMIALWIIGAYLLLSGWILAMEGAAWAGRATGAFDVRSSPVLSALLPERTLERVGPRWMSGFGVEQSAARREDQADFVFKLVDDAVRAVGALPTDRRDAEAPALLARVRLGQRSIADAPLDQVLARHADARDAFARLDARKSAKAALAKLSAALDRAQETEHALAQAGSDAARLAKARDDAAAGVEEVMFSLEDYAKVAPAGDQLAGSKGLVDALQAAADAIRDGTGAFPAADLGTLRAQASASEQTLVAGAAYRQDLAAVEQAVDRLMPVPPGLRGAVHRFTLLLGTDDQGRSILVRGLYSAKIAVQVGVIVAVASVLLGAILGSAAAYFGGWVDHAVTWLYSTLSSLPQLVLLAVLSFMFLGTPLEKTLVPIYVALGLTFWIGPCRVIRGEVLKIKQLEYAQAATVIGFSRPYILLRHVLPNTVHLMFINFSLLFIGAIKSEVILTFLGLGVKEGSSWGLMISQARGEVINGIFWQIGAATVFMLVLVLAFNVVSDALQDAFDPRHVG